MHRERVHITHTHPLPDMHSVMSCCSFITWLMFSILVQHFKHFYIMLVGCWSCFYTAAHPLSLAFLDANAEWSRVTLNLPKARWSCLCWPWREFLGWAFTKLSLNLPDVKFCDLYHLFMYVCLIRTLSTYWGFYFLFMSMCKSCKTLQNHWNSLMLSEWQVVI